MTNEDRDRLIRELSGSLRKRGELVGDLPGDALERWKNVAGMPDQDPPGYDYLDVAAELMSWWRDAWPNARQYVLHDLTPAENAVGEPPAWWPAYEQWLDAEIRPVVDRLTDPASHGGVHPGWDKAIGFLKNVVGLRHEEAWDYVGGDKPLRVPPLRSESTVHPYGARVVITVMSPFVEPQAVAELYARVAGRIRGESTRPPNIKSESMRFYLAYDELVRTFPRDKQARLEALPEDLRGERSANSAAAYFGKLKKSLLAAFEPGGVTRKEGGGDA